MAAGTRRIVGGVLLGGGVEGVDDLAEGDVDLVEGVAGGGVGEQVVFDGFGDEGVDVADLGGRGGVRGGGAGGDVEFCEEGGHDALFFFCFCEVLSVLQLC